jgi:hypothetical protein
MLWSLGTTQLNHRYGYRTYTGRQNSGMMQVLYQDVWKESRNRYRVGFQMMSDDYHEEVDTLAIPLGSDARQAFHRVERVPGVFGELTLDRHRQQWVIGARWDYHSLFGGQFSPRLHWKYDVTDKDQLRLGIGRGFRVASVWAENQGALVSSRALRLVPSHVIAKCILFKNADKRYGIKPNSIGEMKQVVVPYTLSLLNNITDNKLNLYKVWKNQDVSNELSDFIYDLMKQVNQFILDAYNGQHYIEKAKKEECWNLVKNHSWKFSLNKIKSDLIDEKNPPKRNIDVDIAEEELIQNKEIVKSIPPALWNEILQWGKESELFNLTKQTVISNIAFKLRQNKIIADEEYQKGVEILDIVAKNNEELLQKSEEFTGKWVQLKKPKHSDDEKNELIIGLIRKMLSFNQEKEILTQEDTDLLHDISNGKQENDYETQIEVAKCLKKLEKKGFKN